jgi:flagellar biosynthetic protein FliR
MNAPPGGGLALTATAVALGAARTGPVTWLVSPLGGALLPPPARVGFGLVLAALATPALAAGVARAGLDRAGPLLLAAQIGRELAVGVSMGLVASLAFRAAEAAGRLADAARGANLAEVLLPTADERSSPLGALYLLLGTLVFLELGGVPRVLDALARSYDVLPVGGGVTAAGAARAAGVVTLASARLIESALALAAPVIVALWLTDVTLGFVARAAPQIPVYFVGLPLKGLLAVGVVLAGLAALETAMSRGLASWMTLLERVMNAWR